MTTTQLQLRRDTTANIEAVTPAQGEVVFDVTRNALVLGDGTTAGGRPGPGIGTDGTLTPEGNVNLASGKNVTASGTGEIQPIAGSSTTNVNAGGVISMQNTSTGNGADTTEDTLQTFSLPANVFGASGAKLVEVEAYGRYAANGDGKTVRLYFGSELINSGSITENGGGWYLSLAISRTGLNAQRVTGKLQTNNGTIGANSNTGAETETAAITIKCTGQASVANANDIICDTMVVKVWN